MKALILILFVVVASCAPQNTTPTMPVAKPTALDTTKAQLLKKGMFVGLDGPTSGTASVYDQAGSTYVLLDPFESHSGPDLKVYISKDINAKDYIRLGNLQATSGRQVYSVPSGTTIADFNYVHIWCQQYSVDFARAEVK
jgi:hypothetical protein